MIDLGVLRSTLMRRNVFLPIVAAVLVVIIWTVAFFLPQGSKISKLKVQEASLQSKVLADEATVARLRHTYLHSAQLKTVQSKLNTAVPPTANAYHYVQTLSAAVTKAGAHLTSITITSGSGSSASSTSSSETSPSTVISELPITMTVKATYDQILSLITEIYQLPRLTDIEGLSFVGGGANTNRSTALTANLTLLAFSSGKPIAGS